MALPYSEVKPFKNAVHGSWFGILNIFYIFVPFLYSLTDSEFKFYTYLAASLFTLILYVLILIKFKNKRGYGMGELRFLMFVGAYTLILYLGLLFIIFMPYIKTFIFVDYIILFLYILLSFVSVADIFIPVIRGSKRIKTYYKRTYKRAVPGNITVVAIGIILALLLLIPGFMR